jgi:tetratricopeptide (TPR) repeat protein
MTRISWQRQLILAIVGGCLVIPLYYFAARKPKPAVPTQSQLPFLVDHEVDHGYVGWKACAECHAPRVKEFQGTRHFLALQLPNQVEFPHGFNGRTGSFSPPNSPVRFDMALSPTPAITASLGSGHAKSKTTSPIAFVYGAGAGTDEVYFTRRGDKLFELPVVWLHPYDRWGAALFDPYGTGDPSRPLAPQCLECHTVWVDYHRGTLNEYGPFDPLLLGVTCERCHGPAKAHVEHHRSHPDEKTPVDIVQPKSLSRERQMDLCAQCHTNTVRHRRAPFSYRPGEPLDESFLVLEMRYPEDDRVANQVRYLKESRCYQQSDSLTCVTCHDPHRPKSEDPRSSSETCLACHRPDRCGARPRLPSDVQDRCVTCHMPRRYKLQVHFETADGEIVFPAPRYEHRIAIYPEAEQELLYDWYERQTGPDAVVRREQLVDELAKHWMRVAESASERQRFLVAIDAYRSALRFGDTTKIQDALSEALLRFKQSQALWFEGEHQKRENRLDEAIATFQKLLKVEPNLAKAHLEIGTLYAAKGQTSVAVEHLEEAARNDANDPSPHAMLGWIEFLSRNPAEALQHYLQAQKIDPWSHRIERMIGECRLQLGEWEDAALAFEKALTINPGDVEAARALRQVLRERFNAKEALPRAIQAVRSTQGKEIHLLLTLAEIYRDLGQVDDARKTISYTRGLAESTGSGLLTQVVTMERSFAASEGRHK